MCRRVSAAVRPAAARARIQEVWMVQQVKEVTIESERHLFIDFEGLADTKINVRIHRTRNRTTGKVRITPESSVGIDVNTRIGQARGCRHKRGRGLRSLIEVLIHRQTRVRIDHLFPNDRALDTTRTDEIWSVDTRTVLVGVACTVKQADPSTGIPRDDTVHRPAAEPAVAVEDWQIIAERYDYAMTNIEVRRTRVIAKVLHVGCRNCRVSSPENIAEFVERLGICVVGVE